MTTSETVIDYMTSVKRFLESLIPLFWCCFAFWQLLFGMDLSGFLCLMLTPWFLGPLNPKPRKWYQYLGVYSGVLLLLWTIGLHEYARQVRYHSCKAKQAYGIPSNRYPRWCNEFDLIWPQDKSNRRVFSFRERIAVRIHHLATLGIVRSFGLTENTKQAWRMYFVRSPIDGIEFFNLGDRRRLCTDKSHFGGDTRRVSSSFPLGSPLVRHTIATWFPQISQSGSWETKERPLSFYTGNNPLVSILNQDSLHIATALGNRGTLYVKKRANGDFDFSLQASVYYNTETLGYIKIPHPFGTHSIPVDSSMYCGLTMDGWLRPYYQEWRWQMSEIDIKLQTQQDIPTPSPFGEELAVSFLSNYLAQHY